MHMPGSMKLGVEVLQMLPWADMNQQCDRLTIHILGTADGCMQALSKLGSCYQKDAWWSRCSQAVDAKSSMRTCNSTFEKSFGFSRRHLVQSQEKFILLAFAVNDCLSTIQKLCFAIDAHQNKEECKLQWHACYHKPSFRSSCPAMHAPCATPRCFRPASPYAALYWL